jgi:hypothetical protein
VQSVFDGQQKFTEGFDQRWQIVLNGIPDYWRAKVPVGVDREVAEICHLAPGYFRMAACDLGRNVVRGFANKGQIMNYCIYDLFVAFKRFEIKAGSVALDFGDCFENVLNPESPISRWQGSLLAGCVLSKPV